VGFIEAVIGDGKAGASGHAGEIEPRAMGDGAFGQHLDGIAMIASSAPSSAIDINLISTKGCISL
jgi:hypothetical protein